MLTYLAGREVNSYLSNRGKIPIGNEERIVCKASTTCSSNTLLQCDFYRDSCENNRNVPKFEWSNQKRPRIGEFIIDG